MSGVNIGISANPSQVVASFDQVRDAIRRAGQEGRAFRDLDLSHPELGAFAQDLGRMKQQIEDLTRVSQGATARSARRVFTAAPGGADPLNWGGHDADWARMYPDEAERRRLRSRVQSFVTQGTAFAPAPPAPAPVAPPPPAGRGGGGGGGQQYSNEAEDFASGLPSIARSVARSAVQGATFGLSLAGVNGVRSTIANSYHSAVNEGNASDNLFRRMPELSQSFETLRESVRRASDGMGITYQESQRMAGIFVRTRGDPRAPGSMGAEENLASWTHMAAGFGRASGVDASSSAGMFARASNFQDGEKFAMLVGDAAARGFQTGNMERVMESIVRFQETTSRVLVGSGGNVEGFAGMWAAMNATGKPGMRGDNATALIGSLDNAILQGGGGGHASEAATWRAYAKHGVKDPYEMQYLQEEGMFGKLPDGTTNYDAVSGEINREYQGVPKRQRQAALAKHFGISMHQAEALDGLKPENVTGTRSMLEGYGIDAAKINPTSFVDLAKLNASGDWSGAKKRLLDRNDLSADEKTLLNGATGDMLKETIVRTMAAHGMSGTDASRHQDASVNLENRMTEFGDMFVKPVTMLKNGIVDLSDAIKSLSQLMHGGAVAPGATPYLGPGGTGGDGVTPAAFRQIVGAGGGGRSFSMGSAGVTNVAGSIPIADRGRILDAATSGTMVPPALLDALISQESQWRPDAQRQGGSDLGLGQITDSTAAHPGYGIEAISRSDRKDPLKAARWSARYLEARGRALGLTNPADWRDPAKVARALRGYNGGGDANYADHVFSHMHAPHRAPPQSAEPAAATQQISFEPLRVIHEDRHGNELRNEDLPIRYLGPARPYGTEGPLLVDGRRNPLSRQRQQVPVAPTPARDV